MDTKFLDKAGLTYLWTKMRLIFLRKEDFDAKIETTINETSLDTKVASAKAVWTLSDSKIAKDKVGDGLAIDDDGVLSFDGDLSEYQTVDNIVQTIDENSTADTYPSAKATYDYVETLIEAIADGSY